MSQSARHPCGATKSAMQGSNPVLFVRSQTCSFRTVSLKAYRSAFHELHLKRQRDQQKER